MTKSEKTELYRCVRDPKYFIEKYFKVRDPIKGVCSIDLTDKQEKILEDLKSNDFVLDTIDERQIGASTLHCGYALWLSIFNGDMNILLASVKYNQAANLRYILAIGYENLPTFLKIKKVVDRKQSIVFENGTEIIISNSDPVRISGRFVSFAILDDFEFYKPSRQQQFVKYAKDVCHFDVCRLPNNGPLV